MLRVSRRALLRLTASVAASAGVLGSAGSDIVHAAPRAPLLSLRPTPPTDAPPPNVLLITVDTLRADQLGCYGHPFVQTPTLDALAQQGARFTTHLVQQPQTNPSHGSIFTGMYPSSSGIRIHMVDKLPDYLDCLAALFKKAGYSTAGLYSWMSFDPQWCNFQRGFDVYKDLSQQAGQLEAASGAAAASQSNSEQTAPKGRADVTTDAAIAQLQAFGARPFFMWLHYFDPHYPYTPPSSYASLYDPDYTGKLDGSMATIQAIDAGKLQPGLSDIVRLASLYQGEISYFDSQLGRLFSAMDTLGLTKNTVVALTGDHGESFAEHTNFESGGDFFHPHSLFNEEDRTPLLLRYPPRIKPGSVYVTATQAIDIFPTLLELAGLPPSEQAQGTSMVGLLDGADNGDDRLAFAAMPDYVFTAVATPRWKLIQNNANGQRVLFDLGQDPLEQHDLFTVNADTAGQLTDRLQTWMKQVNIS